MSSGQSSRSMTWCVVWVLIVTLIGNINLGSLCVGENIAFFHPTGSYSHRVSLWPLVEKLVANGHQITFISSYPPKNPLPNVTELVPAQMAKYINDYMQGGELDITKRISGHMQACYDHGPNMGLLSCEKFLDDPVIKDWLKTEPKIDLFVVDWYVSECILGLVHKLNAQLIFYAPTVMVGVFYETFGILPDSAAIPDFEQHFTPPLTFWQRAINGLQPIIWNYKYQAYYEKLGEMIRTKMNLPDMPPVIDIVRNASLMMWSESLIEGYHHQLPQTWITVGGMHCKEKTDPLPKDLETIVQKGKDGFIYFSFGSAVVPGNLPQGHRNAFFKAIESFPNIQFLWKWTGKKPVEKLPSNLYIGDWFPQQDILAHKKILAFVTQAGRPSSQEAIFHGVPVIALPVYEDQDYTAERVRDMGGGIVLEIATIKQEEFAEAIREITTNSKYRNRMKHLSKIFRDRPMKPVDTALYWVEYILRHKDDLSHLRSPSYNLTWYERRLLDVWAVFITIGLLAVITTVYIVISCLKLLTRNSSNDNKNDKRKSKKKNQ